MLRKNWMSGMVAVAVVTLVFYGCNSSSAPSSAPADSGGEATTEAGGEQADAAAPAGEESGEMSDMDKMHATLAKLPEADRAAAEKQHMCPVSGEMLGAMGLPIKVTVKGQDVWLCCAGCKDKLLADPDTYLAKLSK